MSQRHASGGDDASTLGFYLREISKLPRLTPEEERALAIRIQRDGDDDAVARLVEANLRFVVSCAKRYRGLGAGFLDLIHEGNLGLLEAARRFDPSRNVKFITYAVWWVREAMIALLADQRRAFSVPPKQLALLRNGPEDVSLSQPVGDARHVPGVADGRGRALADLLAQDGVAIDDVLIHRAGVDGLAAAMADLDGRERAVVRLRYGLDDDREHTLQEIGDRLHLSRERVRQIESRAKEKLRRSTKLRSHLN